MANNLRCECADDDEYRLYQPLYVEAYLNNRECIRQSIEEWTDLEGSQHYAASEIFRRVEVPVAITGTEANAFEVDVTRPDWRLDLQTAVASAVVSAGLAKVTDKVELHDMRRQTLGDKVDRVDLQQLGMVYATVNGQRTIDLPKSKQAGLGCAARTPLTHSPIKDDMLQSYVNDLVVRAKELIIASLTPSTDMYDLNARVTGSGSGLKADVTPSVNIKSQVADLITRDAGLCTTDLGTFDALLKTYADPLVLKAIARGKPTLREVAEKMAGHIVSEVIVVV
jgi:hypothetical protein